jgi:trk system potassium uptake protein TrkA
MQVAVLGLGRFGTELALSLARQGHEVLAIDSSPTTVQLIADDVAKAAIADITEESALRDLGVHNMDAAVVATSALESSVLASINLQELGVQPIYAKASSERHAQILRRLGADRVVEPEKEGGERFAHLLRVRGAQDYLSLTETYGIGLYRASASLQGQTLERVEQQDTTRRLLMVVQDEQVQLNPPLSQTIEPGDLLVFAGTDDDLARELG